eukprot:Hpha_TRINITY_DN22193_c0_g1::TRINITY_DN22193_c0_g1_i1::g.103589::m.103589
MQLPSVTLMRPTAESPRRGGCRRNCGMTLVCCSLLLYVAGVQMVESAVGVGGTQTVDGTQIVGGSKQRQPGTVATGARQVVHFGHEGRTRSQAQVSNTQEREKRERVFTRQFRANMDVLRRILHRKLVLEQTIEAEIAQLLSRRTIHPTTRVSADAQDDASTEDETDRKIGRRKLRKRMLDDLEQGVMRKARKLEDLMKNLTDASLLRDSHSLLEQLQEESVRAQEDYAVAVAWDRADKTQTRRRAHDTDNRTSKAQTSAVRQMLRSVDEELGRAVHVVQHELDADAGWAHARKEHAEMETVVKVVDRGRHAVVHPHGTHGTDDRLEVGLVSTLIDHDNNRYVLARPHDSSIRYEDEKLLFDLVLLAGSCFIGASIAHLLGLPQFFGHIAAGTILSPTQLNLLSNLVQVETLAQLGVYLMLFLLGAEFSIDKLRRVMKAAVGGGVLAMTVTTAIAWAALRFLFQAPAAEGVLIGFCFSLSSTAVVLKCLSEHELVAPYGRMLLGVLVVQDVSLGVMVAIIPLLDGGHDQSLLTECGWLAISLLILSAILFLFCKFVAVRLLRFCASSSELFVLGLVALCFTVMWLSHELGLSMEVGAFATGISIATAGRDWVHRVVGAVRPLQDFFASMFFAAIGFHIYPSFLIRELSLLISVTLFTVGVKYLVGLCVFGFVCGIDLHDASLLSLGLSQLSEFSFVIAAHGKAQGLINREIYFMLIGVTALSLTTTPILWRFHDRKLEPVLPTSSPGIAPASAASPPLNPLSTNREDKDS